MDDDWQSVRGERRDTATPNFSAIHAALLFGSAAVALALIVTSFADRGAGPGLLGRSGLDAMSTGSVGPAGSTYTVRRSVLQPSPQSICVIEVSGLRRGEC